MSSSTITASSILVSSSNTPWSKSTISPISDIWNSVERDSKKYTSDVDLLAVSVHQYRLYHDDPSRRFIFPVSPGTVTPSVEDYQQADIIADHYGSKFTWDLLKGERKLTSFEQSVSEFINSGRTVFTSRSIGMIYRLPEFYYHDLKLNQIIQDNFSSTVGCRPDESTQLRRLAPLDKRERKTRGIHEHEYWLKDLELNLPVKIAFYSPFQLSAVWDRLFDNSDVLHVHSIYSCHQHPLGFKYLRCKKWELDFDRHFRLDRVDQR